MPAPIRHFLSRGLDKIGLGTDSGGGFSSSILEAARLAFIVSNARQSYHSQDPENSKFRPGPPHVAQPSPQTASTPPPQEHQPHPTPIPATTDKDDDNEKPLTLPECFYLATLGGARVCNLSHLIGNFEPGKEFDALLVDMSGKAGTGTGAGAGDAAVDILHTSSTPIEPDTDTPWAVFEKFMWTGDDRNIAGVWVRGRRVV